jgi:hypothetical protein
MVTLENEPYLYLNVHAPISLLCPLSVASSHISTPEVTIQPKTMTDDEKKASILSESQLSRSDDEGQEITWTEDEEKALVQRYDTVHQSRSS